MTKYQIRVELDKNLNDFERQEKDLKNIKLVLKHIDKETCKIADCFRLGRYNKDRQRLRSILVTFTSVWDRNLVIQSSKLLKNFPDKIFIVPALTPFEMEIERKSLKRRLQLIESGTNRDSIKVKNLNLFVDIKKIEVGST